MSLEEESERDRKDRREQVANSARNSLEQLLQVMESVESAPADHLSFIVDEEIGEETVLELPREALEALQEILASLEKGNEVEVVAKQRELSTTEAAQILNVSRPYVVELMESGELPFHKVGSHRRVEAADVLEYKRNQKEKSREKLQALAQEDEKLDIEY